MLRLGLVGLGTVGRALVEQILDLGAESPFCLDFIHVRDQAKAERAWEEIWDAKRLHRHGRVQCPPFPKAPALVLPGQTGIQVLVDCCSDTAYSRDLIASFLASSVSVVTASKAAIAPDLPDLERLAHNHGASFFYEASVCGGIPVIHLGKEYHRFLGVERLEGIINGTCNYILSLMETQGIDFDQALQEAQKNGFAEADPRADISGTDSAQKLSILTWVYFGAWVPPGQISVTGLEHIGLSDVNLARDKGQRIRLIARAVQRSGKMELQVAPERINSYHPLYDVEQENNALLVHSRGTGPQKFWGKGAGGVATASAMFADLQRLISLAKLSALA